MNAWDDRVYRRDTLQNGVESTHIQRHRRQGNHQRESSVPQPLTVYLALHSLVIHTRRTSPRPSVL